MQIDRSRFLLLTATMASGACGGASQPATGDPVVAAPIVTLPAEDKPPSAESRAVAGAQAGEGEPSDDVRATLEASGSSSSPDDPSMCDDGGVAPKGCSTLRAPGPQCESFTDTRDMCGKLARGLKPRVAEKAVDCLLAKSGKQAICSFDTANQCGMAAVRKGCIEPSTQSACGPAVRACGGRLAMKDCQALVSSVTDKNRRSMIACVTEGCSIDSCMYSVE